MYKISVKIFYNYIRKFSRKRRESKKLPTARPKPPSNDVFVLLEIAHVRSQQISQQDTEYKIQYKHSSSVVVVVVGGGVVLLHHLRSAHPLLLPCPLPPFKTVLNSSMLKWKAVPAWSSMKWTRKCFEPSLIHRPNVLLRVLTRQDPRDRRKNLTFAAASVKLPISKPPMWSRMYVMLLWMMMVPACFSLQGTGTSTPESQCTMYTMDTVCSTGTNTIPYHATPYPTIKPFVCLCRKRPNSKTA
jgi:hypothetical protein